MRCMFSGCSSLEELNISHFNTKNVTDIIFMFSGCSDNLKKKIRNLNLKINEEAFEE